MESLRGSLLFPSVSVRRWADELGFLAIQPSPSLREVIEFARSPQTYEVAVKTGDRYGAGTDAGVQITIFGNWGSLPQSLPGNFEKNNLDTSHLAGPHLGHIDRIRVRLGWEKEVTGFEGQSWFLDYITIRKVSTNQSWSFPCNRWLSKNKGTASDCAFDLIIYTGGPAIPNPEVEHPCAGSSSGTVGSTPPAVKGVKEVQLYNCYWPATTVHVWVFDATAGTKKEVGTLPTQYDSNGTCPGFGPDAIVISLEEDHQYWIVAVSPDREGCGANDPTNASCQIWHRECVGDSDGFIVRTNCVTDEVLS